jgi:phage terminase small subunit
MSKLTAKQAAFCREYIVDCNGTQAAIRAGFSERTAQEQASQMLALPHIDAEVRRLQEELAAANNVTVATLLIEAEQARAIAKTAKNASAMVAATTLKARLCGLLVDRIEDMVAREKLAAERESIGEVRKAGQLLAEAAKSLDLPERATPAQIVGALAQREFITPEAFVLLRASRMAENEVQ